MATAYAAIHALPPSPLGWLISHPSQPPFVLQLHNGRVHRYVLVGVPAAQPRKTPGPAITPIGATDGSDKAAVITVDDRLFCVTWKSVVPLSDASEPESASGGPPPEYSIPECCYGAARESPTVTLEVTIRRDAPTDSYGISIGHTSNGWHLIASSTWPDLRMGDELVTIHVPHEPPYRCPDLSHERVISLIQGTHKHCTFGVHRN